MWILHDFTTCSRAKISQAPGMSCERSAGPRHSDVHWPCAPQVPQDVSEVSAAEAAKKIGISPAYNGIMVGLSCDYSGISHGWMLIMLIQCYFFHFMFWRKTWDNGVFFFWWDITWDIFWTYFWYTFWYFKSEAMARWFDCCVPVKIDGFIVMLNYQ